MTLRLHLFLLLLCSGTQVLGVHIDSSVVSSDGVIQIGVDKTVSLVCHSGDNTDPEEELVWLRNGAYVKLQDENKHGRSSVCITPVIHEDNGATFTCHLGKNSSISASVKLNVTYRPDLSGADEVSVEEEAELFLECDIWANPQVSSVFWTLNENKVDLLSGGFTVTTDGYKTKLYVHRVQRISHQGKYQCTATSSMHGEHSKIFYVTVTDKTMEFPMMPIIAGVVVVCLTLILAVASRWKRIVKCCK